MSVEITADDLPLVRQVLQDVIYDAQKMPGLEYDGKPIYQITHVELNQILARYREDAS